MQWPGKERAGRTRPAVMQWGVLRGGGQKSGKRQEMKLDR